MPNKNEKLCKFSISAQQKLLMVNSTVYASRKSHREKIKQNFVFSGEESIFASPGTERRNFGNL